MNTVSLCMIVKNEIHNIEKLLRTVTPILEEVILVDTGSTDGTLEKIQELQKEFLNIQLQHFEWIHDFSAARNYSFSLATKDWIYWNDGDDLVNDIGEFLRFKNDHLDNPNVDAWMLDYIYSRLPNGQPSTVLGRERFLRRSKNPQWKGAIHETVDLTGFRQKEYKPLKIIHQREGKVIEPRRNLKILEKEFEKNPNDARTAYYYGKELFDHIDPKGVEVLESYLKLPGWKWYDDHVNALFRVAKHYISVNKLTEAIQAAEKIYHLDSTRDRAEYYWIYGTVEQVLGNYRVAIEWFERCLRIPPSPPRVLNLEYYTWHPHKKLAECHFSLRDYTKGMHHARQVEAILPTDQGIRAWVRQLASVVLPVQGGLRVLEISFQDTALRSDSHVFNKEGSPQFNPQDPPFQKGSLDGIVGPYYPKLEEALRPGGFYWVIQKTPFNSLVVNDISYSSYRGQKLWNSIKADPDLPSIGLPGVDLEFGPSRIRFENLRKSFVKAAYPVMTFSSPHECPARFIISPRFQGKLVGDSIAVLDICEQLPNYKHTGIEYADLVVTCSPKLLAHVKSLHPDKTVINVDDHFEMDSGDWL